MSTPNVTLQINVAPTDLPHAAAILPHQLRQWGAQVAHIQFTLDLPRGGRGRFVAGAQDKLPAFRALLDRLCRDYPHARVVEVDYGDAAKAAVSSALFGGATVPEKDSRGGPFYSYVFGIHAAPTELVLHTDSDMMFGGGSQAWTGLAADLLAAQDQVLACCPFPGPPRPDGELTTQSGERLSGVPPSYRFRKMTTRVFLIDRARLRSRVGPLVIGPPPLLRSRVKSKLLGHEPFALVEDLLTEAMVRHGLQRVDFLGPEPGMWSMHPPFRSAEFYEGLHDLVARIETGDVPDAQRGDYDMNSSMIDWTEAAAAFRRRRWFS